MGLDIGTNTVNWEWLKIFELCSRNDLNAKVYKVFICVVICYILQERNFRKFRNESRPWGVVRDSIQREVKLNLQEVLATTKDSRTAKILLQKLGIVVTFTSKKPIFCTWFKPPEGFVKLNSDGAVSESRNGFGGVVRDSHGDVLLAYVGASKKASAIVQELNGILVGLKGCKMIQQKKILVASDSLQAIQILQGKVRR